MIQKIDKHLSLVETFTTNVQRKGQDILCSVKVNILVMSVISVKNSVSVSRNCQVRDDVS